MSSPIRAQLRREVLLLKKDKLRKSVKSPSRHKSLALPSWSSVSSLCREEPLAAAMRTGAHSLSLWPGILFHSVIIGMVSELDDVDFISAAEGLALLSHTF